MKICNIIGLSLLVFTAVPAFSKVEVETTTISFSIKKVPKTESNHDKDSGTTVLLQLVNTAEGKPLSGAEIETSEISFSDSTGRDLFAEGKKTKAAYRKGAYRKGNRVLFSISSDQDSGNCMSVMLPETLGRDKFEPGTVYLRCHALTTPAEKAAGVSIKGKLAVYAGTGETKTFIITKKQLTSGKPLQIDDLTIEFRSFGGGFSNDRSYSHLEFRSLAVLRKITVEGADESKLPITFEGTTIKAYEEELKDSDKIEITYSLPEKSVVDIDIDVTPGSIGL